MSKDYHETISSFTVYDVNDDILKLGSVWGPSQLLVQYKVTKTVT